HLDEALAALLTDLHEGGPSLACIPNDPGVNASGGLDLLLCLGAELYRREAVAQAEQHLELIDPLQERAGLLGGTKRPVPGLDIHRIGVRIQAGGGRVDGSRSGSAESHPTPPL